MGVLVVASKSDTASMTLYNAMMRLDGWSESFSSSLGDYYIHECSFTVAEGKDSIDHINRLITSKFGRDAFL